MHVDKLDRSIQHQTSATPYAIARHGASSSRTRLASLPSTDGSIALHGNTLELDSGAAKEQLLQRAQPVATPTEDALETHVTTCRHAERNSITSAKRPRAPLQPISVMCSPPGPAHVAAKRLRGTTQLQGTNRAATCADASNGGQSAEVGLEADGEDTIKDDAEGDRGQLRKQGAVYGIFHPDRYLNGQDCIDYQGNFITRSKFEKLGGSLMAKWYRSIRVVTTDEPLGAWLTRRGLPVLKGNPRNRRQGLGNAASKAVSRGGGKEAPRHGRGLGRRRGHGRATVGVDSGDDEESPSQSPTPSAEDTGTIAAADVSEGALLLAAAVPEAEAEAAGAGFLRQRDQWQALAGEGCGSGAWETWAAPATTATGSPPASRSAPQDASYDNNSHGRVMGAVMAAASGAAATRGVLNLHFGSSPPVPGTTLPTEMSCDASPRAAPLLRVDPNGLLECRTSWSYAFGRNRILQGSSPVSIQHSSRAAAATAAVLTAVGSSDGSGAPAPHLPYNKTGLHRGLPVADSGAAAAAPFLAGSAAAVASKGFSGFLASDGGSAQLPSSSRSGCAGEREAAGGASGDNWISQTWDVYGCRHLFGLATGGGAAEPSSAAFPEGRPAAATTAPLDLFQPSASSLPSTSRPESLRTEPQQAQSILDLRNPASASGGGGSGGAAAACQPMPLTEASWPGTSLEMYGIGGRSTSMYHTVAGPELDLSCGNPRMSSPAKQGLHSPPHQQPPPVCLAVPTGASPLAAAAHLGPEVRPWDVHPHGHGHGHAQLNPGAGGLVGSSAGRMNRIEAAKWELFRAAGVDKGPASGSDHGGGGSGGGGSHGWVTHAQVNSGRLDMAAWGMATGTALAVRQQQQQQPVRRQVAVGFEARVQRLLNIHAAPGSSSAAQKGLTAEGQPPGERDGAASGTFGTPLLGGLGGWAGPVSGGCGGGAGGWSVPARSLHSGLDRLLDELGCADGSLAPGKEWCCDWACVMGSGDMGSGLAYAGAGTAAATAAALGGGRVAHAWQI